MTHRGRKGLNHAQVNVWKPANERDVQMTKGSARGVPWSCCAMLCNCAFETFETLWLLHFLKFVTSQRCGTVKPFYFSSLAGPGEHWDRHSSVGQAQLANFNAFWTFSELDSVYMSGFTWVEGMQVKGEKLQPFCSKVEWFGQGWCLTTNIISNSKKSVENKWKDIIISTRDWKWLEGFQLLRPFVTSMIRSGDVWQGKRHLLVDGSLPIGAQVVKVSCCCRGQIYSCLKGNWAYPPCPMWWSFCLFAFLAHTDSTG